VGVYVLPRDALAQPLDFDTTLPSVLPDSFRGLTANGIGHLDRSSTTSSAMVRYQHGANHSEWRGFAAVRRDGGVEVGIGATARYQNQGEPPLNGFRLFVLIHAVRIALESESGLLDRLVGLSAPAAELSPFEIIVAIPDTEGAVLGGLNEGWDPPEHAFNPPRALEQNVLVRLDIEEWPTDSSGREDVFFRVADRMCEAFGDDQRRYIARRGANAGRMSAGYA